MLCRPYICVSSVLYIIQLSSQFSWIQWILMPKYCVQMHMKCDIDWKGEGERERMRENVNRADVVVCRISSPI